MRDCFIDSVSKPLSWYKTIFLRNKIEELQSQVLSISILSQHSRMTYLGKKIQESEESDVDKPEAVNVNRNKDDILKQSIKTIENEDTSLFFVQTGLVAYYMN